MQVSWEMPYLQSLKFLSISPNRENQPKKFSGVFGDVKEGIWKLRIQRKTHSSHLGDETVDGTEK